MTASARKKLVFAYDFNHRRLAKTVYEWKTVEGTLRWALTKDVRFVHDEWQMIAELDHTSATGTGLAGSEVDRTFLWGPDLSGSMTGAGGVGGLLSTTYQGGTYEVCSDANGNITGLVPVSGTGAGTLVARFEYDLFGHRVTNAGPSVELCPLGFSSKCLDTETGVVSYELRGYLPGLGRWMSRDLIGERGGINLYGMVRNDVVNRVDVLGLVETIIPTNPPNCIVRLRQMHGPSGAHAYQKEDERSVDALATSAAWSAGRHEAGIIGYPSFYGRLSLLSCEYDPAAGARFLIPGVKGSPAGAVGYSTSGTDIAPGGLAGRNYSNGGHGPLIVDYAAYVNESWQAALKEGNSLADKCGKDKCCACQEIKVIFEAAADDHHRAWNGQPTLPYDNAFLDTPMAQHINSSSPNIDNSGLPNLVDPNPQSNLPTKVPNIPKSGQSFNFKIKR